MGGLSAPGTWPNTDPPAHLIDRSAFLIRLHHERRLDPGSGRMTGENGAAVAKPVTTMGDERPDRLAAKIMGLQEGPDDRRRGFAPDRKAEKDCLVAGEVAICSAIVGSTPRSRSCFACSTVAS